MKVCIRDLVNNEHTFTGNHTVRDIRKALFKNNNTICLEFVDNYENPERIVLEPGDDSKKVKDVFKDGHTYVFYPGANYPESQVYIKDLVNNEYAFTGNQTVGDIRKVLFSNNNRTCLEFVDDNKKPKKIILEPGDKDEKIEDIFEDGHIYTFYPGENYPES